MFESDEGHKSAYSDVMMIDFQDMFLPQSRWKFKYIALTIYTNSKIIYGIFKEFPLILFSQIINNIRLIFVKRNHILQETLLNLICPSIHNRDKVTPLKSTRHSNFVVCGNFYIIISIFYLRQCEGFCT